MQKLFIALALSAYILQVIWMLSLLRQVGLNGWISPFLLVVFEAILLPPILFLLAYGINPNNQRHVSRYFHSVLYVIIALLFEVILRAVIDLVQFTSPDNLMTVIQIIPTLVIVPAYIGGLVWLNRSTTELPTPLGLQKILIVTVASAFTVMNGSLLYRIVQQYPSNQNLSSFFTASMESLLLPIIFFGFAYIVSSRKMLQMQRIFEATLYAIMGLLLFAIINSPILYMYRQLLVLDKGYYALLMQYLLSVILTVSLYAAVIIVHKRSRT